VELAVSVDLRPRRCLRSLPYTTSATRLFEPLGSVSTVSTVVSCVL
jgi:hypothetical protein